MIKSTTQAFSLSSETADKLEKYAAHLHTSKSALVNAILTLGLQAMDEATAPESLKKVFLNAEK